jgi:hypothetical protein
MSYPPTNRRHLVSTSFAMGYMAVNAPGPVHIEGVLEARPGYNGKQNLVLISNDRYLSEPDHEYLIYNR